MKLAHVTALAALVALVGAAFAALWFMSASNAAGPKPPPVFTDAPGEPSAAEPSKPERKTARQVFGHACGSCHTLSAARSTGLFGPDLDEVRPSAARVRRMLRTGSLDGVMQPNILRGREAREMAEYVARVAGS